MQRFLRNTFKFKRRLKMTKRVEPIKPIKPTSFLLDPDLLRKFRIACAERGCKMSRVVSELIRTWIKNGEPPKGKKTS